MSNSYAMRSAALRPELLSSDDPLTQLYAIHDNQDQLPVAITDVCAKRSTLIKELDLALPTLEACIDCLLYTSPSPRDATLSRMPSSA